MPDSQPNSQARQIAFLKTESALRSEKTRDLQSFQLSQSSDGTVTSRGRRKRPDGAGHMLALAPILSPA